MRPFVMRLLTTLGLIAALAVTTVPSASAVASSSSKVVVNNERLAEAFFNRGAPAWIDLYDAKCDAHPVYVEYRVNGGSTSRHNNNDGCGRTTRVNLRTGYFTIQYRACVNVQLGGDPCGPWRSDHN